MKILTFSTLWPNQHQPLHGLFVRERIKALAELSEVRIMAPVPWFPPIKWLGDRYYKYSQIQLYEKQGDLDVLHPRYLTLPKIGKSFDGSLMFYSLRTTIKTLYRKFAFDLIDAHWAYPDGYAASLIAKEIGVPYTVTVRGNDMTVFAQEERRGKRIYQSLMGSGGVICVSRSLQQLVTTMGVPIERTKVFENGVDPQKFFRVSQAEARQRLQLPQDARIILSVGHLCERKGFHLLIKAVSELNTEQYTGSPTHLLIVGGQAHWDSYRDVLVRQIEENRLHESVSLVGPKSPEELRSWYSAADIFCLASSREGCPNVVLESLACGTPVVATAVSGTPDILSRPDIGILVERDVDKIKQGLRQALERTWSPETIITYARETYSWKTTAQNVYDVFERLLK